MSAKDFIIKTVQILEKEGPKSFTALASRFGTSTAKAYLPWVIRILLLYDIVEVHRPYEYKRLKVIKLKPDAREKLVRLLEDWNKKVEPYES